MLHTAITSQRAVTGSACLPTVAKATKAKKARVVNEASENFEDSNKKDRSSF
jgi:hypothetical protein